MADSTLQAWAKAASEVPWQAWAAAAAVVAAPFLLTAAKDAAVDAAIQHTATAAKPSKLALATLKYAASRFEPLRTYEGRLATLPVPALKDTCERYLKGIRALCATEEDFQEASKQVTEFFASTTAEELQQVLLDRAAGSKNWLADWCGTALLS